MEANFVGNPQGSKEKSSNFCSYLVSFTFNVSMLGGKNELHFLYELLFMRKPEEITDLFLNILQEFVRVICQSRESC